MTRPDNPREYQTDAVEAIVKGLTGGGPGQLDAACGTGKTRMAQRSAERLVPGPGLVVLLTPSLALVAQTLSSWVDAAQVPYAALAVCSDDTVADAPVHAQELPVPVTTDQDQIRDWLDPAQRQVIVGTYLSAGKIVDALRARHRIVDFLICDEAHRLAGRTEFITRRVLDRTWFPAARTLYMTATRRLNAGYQGEADVVGMDDETVFGPVLFTYSFADAIGAGILKDYRVVVVGISDHDGRRMLASTDTEFVDRLGAPDLRTVVAQAALIRAHHKFRLQRVLTYHPRVASAAEFARTLPRAVQRVSTPSHRPVVPVVGHVHGAMNQAQRERVLEHLRNPPEGGWAVVSNARCLGEGVDIPAIDTVMFANAKSSSVDIVQAVGRALRRSEHAEKATIVVPIIVPDESGEIGDLDAGDYRVLWQVIRALRAYDESLGLELDTQRSQLSSMDEEVKLPSRITVELAPGVSDRVLQSLKVLLLRQTTSVWWEGFTAAKVYWQEHGDLDVPRGHVQDGVRLGQWLTYQRSRQTRGQLAADRVTALESLGMSWELRYRPPSQWLASCAAFRAEHGHLNVPQRHVTATGERLGSWVSNQRVLASKGGMPADRRAALDELGMLWDASGWALGLAAARSWHAEHGHLKVPKNTTHLGVQLTQWVESQRQLQRAGELPADRFAALDELGLVWEPLEAHWARGYAAAQTWYAEHGHLNVPKDATVAGYDLPGWIDRRRTDRRAGRLSTERVSALDTLSMVWDPHVQDWRDGLADLQEFYAEHGHVNVTRHVRGARIKALGMWVSRRKTEWNRGELPSERIAALEALGLEATHRKAVAARPYLSAARTWHAEHGHLRVPSSYITSEGIKLGVWLVTRRSDQRKGTIRAEVAEELTTIDPGWAGL